MYKPSDIIDESGKIPMIDRRRVSIFDVMVVIDTKNNPKEYMKDVWDLSDGEVEYILTYIQENNDELQRLQNKFKKQLENN